MEENIMTNENVVEVAEEIAEKVSGETFGTGAKIGFMLVGAVGGLVGRYLAKHLITKIRDIKSKKDLTIDTTRNDEDIVIEE